MSSPEDDLSDPELILERVAEAMMDARRMWSSPDTLELSDESTNSELVQETHWNVCSFPRP